MAAFKILWLMFDIFVSDCDTLWCFLHIFSVWPPWTLFDLFLVFVNFGKKPSNMASNIFLSPLFCYLSYMHLGHLTLSHSSLMLHYCLSFFSSSFWIVSIARNSVWIVFIAIAIKVNEIIPFPATWVNLEMIILNEIRQRQI